MNSNGKIENVKLNALSDFNDRYITTKRGTYDGKAYTYFRDFNVLKDHIKHESFTVIPINSLLYLLMKTNIICKYI